MGFRIGDFGSKIDPALRERKGGFVRIDGRSPDQLRDVVITPKFAKHAEGSALIEVGETKVICTASVEDRLPPWLKGKGRGWITAEYGMLPRATSSRVQREASRGRTSGRTHEIQRLIGRSLRAVVDLTALKDKTIWVDCDVIQADGGTRTAAITGAFVAMVEALSWLKAKGAITELPVTDFVAATSVGKLQGEILLDLNYAEDSTAQVDMNLVKTGRGRFVEVQGTAEASPFGDDDLQAFLAVADKGIAELIAHQRRVLGELELEQAPA
jgi:ribonuclease PH